MIIKAHYQKLILALFAFTIGTFAFPSPAHACFLGMFGCEPNTPSPFPMMTACFGRLPSTPPVDEAGHALKRGDIRMIRTRCPGDNLVTESSMDLLVAPKVENGKIVLYIMKEHNNRLQVKKFQLADVKTASNQFNINLPPEYESACRAGTETSKSPVTLSINYNASNTDNPLRVSHTNVFDPQARQVQGHEALGPEITQMILNEALIDARQLDNFPISPAFSTRTRDEARNYCSQMASQTSLLPKGSTEDGSHEKIIRAQSLLLDSLTPRVQATQPQHRIQPTSSGAGSRVN